MQWLFKSVPLLCAALLFLTGAPARATLSDPVQDCLDNIQRKNSAHPHPGAPSASLIGSTAVANPAKSLPLACLDGRLMEIKAALGNQIANCKAKTPAELDGTFQFGCREVTKRDYCLNASQQLLALANTPGMTYAKFAQQAAKDFDWFESNGRPKDASDNGSKPPKIPIGMTQFTGYFSPIAVDASEVPTAEYQYPVYSAPPGLTYIEHPSGAYGCGINPVTNEPIHWCIQQRDGSFDQVPTREQIFNGALKGDELAYFKNLYDVESLMLEGSGSVNLKQADGSVKKMVLNYVGMNGHSNNLLGNVIKCEGKKITGSWEQYYDAHPQEAFTDTVHYNPSMVFYQPGTDFMGTDHIPVTANATIATDIKNSIPLGTVTLFNLPAKDAVSKPSSKCKTVSTVALSQDTGGAIRNAHIDIYRGEGAGAEALANKTNDAGLVYMAVPKGAGQPVAGCP